MTKYVDNSFHALKVAFANEIGALCAALGLDSHEVMDIFLADTKLNISAAYLRPGFAFGGSCLPKDVRALTHTARQHDVELPGARERAASPTRRSCGARSTWSMRARASARSGIFGLSFKPGTDDLRESPMVELAERLIGKGYDVRIYDANVALSRLIGANRAYIEEHLPHIGELLTDDIDAVLAHARGVHRRDVQDPAVVDAIDRVGPDHTVIDLVRLPDAAARRPHRATSGIGW